MEEEKTEGLLLRSIPYLGRSYILKVFTPNFGLISLMTKNPAHVSLTIPFLTAEWVYKKRQSEIHTLKDASLIHFFSELRKEYSLLNWAGQLVQDLLRSQLPEKPSRGIYALILAYLQKLPSFKRPETLIASFRLKILLHDGLLNYSKACTHCSKTASHIEKGESVCLHHKTEEGVAFLKSEWDALEILTFSRSFSALQDIAITNELAEKIQCLFQQNF